MNQVSLQVSILDSKLLLKFTGEINLSTVTSLQKQILTLKLTDSDTVEMNFDNVTLLDTAGALFIRDCISEYKNISIVSKNETIHKTLSLTEDKDRKPHSFLDKEKMNFLHYFGKSIYNYYLGLVSFFEFLGHLFVASMQYIRSPKNIRYKEILFEINESGLKALAIVMTTSFLIGLVVAYQSAYQLKLYGANIFLVDMLGISMLRELAPIITAIVIAGRSGSAFTAQIGAMKITEELDAMRTMGFDPYAFLVLPRIVALMIVLPLLIFVADMMGVLGGILVANVELGIAPSLFLERFTNVVDIKHFYIGILKGPFFAFLIATIAVYRGLRVKDDTQSIGFNTTKGVVEAIFAVIVCDALFSIVFTNLGI